MTNLDNVKILLEIDSDVYDEKLNLLISSSIEKLKIEGVEEIVIGAINYNMYLTCLSYQIAVDLSLDIDFNTMYRKYITFVNTLRNSNE